MRRLRSIKQAARDSRGAVLVLVALALPALIGFSGLVIDVGNWFEHRRHLQVQADAGALAAAGEFRAPAALCDNDAITSMATSYSGVDYNPQVGSTPPENVLRAYNSKTWPNQPDTPVDKTVDARPPCDAKMIDVKLAETDLPWLLRAARVVPFINAHARVALRTQMTSRGALPIGVPDVNPKEAWAVFVNEATGAVIQTTPLERDESSDGLAVWNNTALPVPVTIAERVGVRIVLSGKETAGAGPPACTATLVDCYDAGSANGLVSVRGWSQTPAGSATAPQARSVELISAGGSCQDGYFMAVPIDGSPCTIGVRASVDFGTEPVASSKLVATRAGSNTKYPLTYDPATGRWESAATIPVRAGDGPVAVTLGWSTGCPVNGNCARSGSFGVLHRTFGGDDPADSNADPRSGPVKRVRVLLAGVPTNSFERGTTPDLAVSIGIEGSLRKNAESVKDPLVTLKFAGSGSLNQKLNCDPDVTTTADEIALGCSPGYRENLGEECPGGAELWTWANPPAWPCVRLDPGEEPNAVAEGLNLRILGDKKATVCGAPSNWADFESPGLARDDPRIVEVFLTPFGTFNESGANTTVPISGFATFYVTGWAGQGGGFKNPCPAKSDGGLDDDAVPGSIVGHFIKYIDTLNTGEAGEELCDFDSFGRCVAVLER